jgi:hypothetical protein
MGGKFNLKQIHMNKPTKKSTGNSSCLRMFCPNTATDVLLTKADFGMSAAEFSAFAFQGRPFVSSAGVRYPVSFTLHDGWAQLSLYHRNECAGIAALGWEATGLKRADSFMAKLAAVTGAKMSRPKILNPSGSCLLALLDRSFLKTAAPKEINAALNTVAAAGFGLWQHIQRNPGNTAFHGPLRSAKIRLLKTSRSMLQKT